MKLTKNEDNTFTFERENGSVTFTGNEISLLVNQYMHLSLRESIEYELKNADGDTINLAKYPYSFDELVDEVYVDLADEVDYGNIPTEDDIKDKIADTADFYEMLID